MLLQKQYVDTKFVDLRGAVRNSLTKIDVTTKEYVNNNFVTKSSGTPTVANDLTTKECVR